MSKYKIGHYETLQRCSFPQVFTPQNIAGETEQNQQPSLDEILEWLGNPDDVE